jgi:hypothetical protein
MDFVDVTKMLLVDGAIGEAVGILVSAIEEPEEAQVVGVLIFWGLRNLRDGIR